VDRESTAAQSAAISPEQVAAAKPAPRAAEVRASREEKRKTLEDSIIKAFDSGDVAFLENTLALSAEKSPDQIAPEIAKLASEYLAILKDPRESVDRCRASAMDPRVQALPPGIQ